MDFLKLLVIFIVILTMLVLKQKLWVALFASILLACVLFQIPPLAACSTVIHSVTSSSTISLVCSLYIVTYLTRMLDHRSLLNQAEYSLNLLFHNRRLTCMLAPFFVGLVPSAAAIYMSGKIVNSSCGDYLNQEEKTFVTTFFRHLPEAFLPTYASILLALQLSGVSIRSFLICMLPTILFLILLGYLFYLRKVPKELPNAEAGMKSSAIKLLLNSLWTILLSIILIIALHLPVYAAISIVIVFAVFYYHFSFQELVSLIPPAFESNIIISTFFCMIFKDILTYTDIIQKLPELFAQLPIPTYLAFAAIFFTGALIGGTTAILALCLPLAYSSIPDGGTALLVLLMSFSYAASQMTPTHICLLLATEYFGISFTALLKRTLPIIILYCLFVVGYFNLLMLVSHSFH